MPLVSVGQKLKEVCLYPTVSEASRGLWFQDYSGKSRLLFGLTREVSASCLLPQLGKVRAGLSWDSPADGPLWPPVAAGPWTRVCRVVCPRRTQWKLQNLSRPTWGVHRVSLLLCPTGTSITSSGWGSRAEASNPTSWCGTGEVTLCESRTGAHLPFGSPVDAYPSPESSADHRRGLFPRSN